MIEISDNSFFFFKICFWAFMPLLDRLVKIGTGNEREREGEGKREKGKERERECVFYTSALCQKKSSHLIFFPSAP